MDTNTVQYNTVQYHRLGLYGQRRHYKQHKRYKHILSNITVYRHYPHHRQYNTLDQGSKDSIHVGTIDSIHSIDTLSIQCLYVDTTVTLDNTVPSISALLYVQHRHYRQHRQHRHILSLFCLYYRQYRLRRQYSSLDHGSKDSIDIIDSADSLPILCL